MPVSMYMGEPLHGQKPSIAIDLFDSSLNNLAPSYLTHKLNDKIMNGLTDKSGTITIVDDTIKVVFDDGTYETMQIGDNTYTIRTFSAKGIKLKETVITVDEASGSIRQDVTYDGSVNGVVDFATATWEEIEIMLQRHYEGIINLADFWSVGATRNHRFGSMMSNEVGESHNTSTQKIVILGFDHDIVTGGTKSAITLGLLNGLGNPGYINATNTNVGGWGTSARRSWCNNTFYNSLESGLKSLIKPVDKMYTAGNRSNVIKSVSDKCFLLSETEIFGNNAGVSFGNEGKQYNYFLSGGSQRKRQGDNVSGYDNWLTRSTCKDDANHFVYVENDGDPNQCDANSNYQIIPAFCI